MKKSEKKIVVGVDLDNTIINYEELFFTEALTAGYISACFIKDKKKIRNSIRSLENGEEKWQRIQATIYGKKIINAQLYKGAKDFFYLCRQLDIEVHIISHKTKYAALNKTINLRDSALSFLQKKGFFSENLIKIDRIFFESTREKKNNRIRDLNCDFFIDDLFEIFADPYYPQHVGKILFDANKTHFFLKDIKIVKSWAEIIDFLIEIDTDQKIKTLLKEYCGHDDTEQDKIATLRINHGKNSRVYFVDHKLETFVIKFYVNDQRKRMKRECMAFSFFMANKFLNVPALLGADFTNGCSLFQHIKGKNVDENEITYSDIDDLIGFIKQIKMAEKKSNENMNAADACISPIKIIKIIDNRMGKFKRDSFDGLSGKLFSFINNSLKPYWKIVNANIIEIAQQNKIPLNFELEKRNQILSPSDFGFHNAIRAENGTIFFIDFEYFGWDDPVKLIVDFIIHPGMDINFDFKRYFFQKMLKLFSNDKTLKVRIRMYLPALIIQWVLIILNEFVPEYYCCHEIENNFKSDFKNRQIVQLEKAKKLFKTREKLINNVEQWINEI